MIKKTITLFALIILSVPIFSQTYFENREDIPEKYTWDMTLIFEDWNQWKENYKETEKLVESFVIDQISKLIVGKNIFSFSFVIFSFT